VPSGNTVTLTLYFEDLEHDSGCTFDYLEIKTSKYNFSNIKIFVNDNSIREHFYHRTYLQPSIISIKKKVFLDIDSRFPSKKKITLFSMHKFNFNILLA